MNYTNIPVYNMRPRDGTEKREEKIIEESREPPILKFPSPLCFGFGGEGEAGQKVLG